MTSSGRQVPEYLSVRPSTHIGAAATPLTNTSKDPEGLKTARLFMVLSSMSPLFLLWAIRGNSFVRDKYLLTFCGLMLVLPNLFLGLRIKAALKANDRRDLTVGTAEDHRNHLLVYL